MVTRVGIYFRGDKVATAYDVKGVVVVEGSDGAKSVVKHYRTQAEGHELLALLLRRLRSQWLAADESVRV